MDSTRIADRNGQVHEASGSVVSQALLSQRPKKREWKVKLIALLQNINGEMGITGPVQLDGDSGDDEPQGKGKGAVDQQAPRQDNPDITECSKR